MLVTTFLDKSCGNKKLFLQSALQSMFYELFVLLHFILMNEEPYVEVLRISRMQMVNISMFSTLIGKVSSCIKAKTSENSDHLRESKQTLKGTS